jgi:hypothetical protein
MYSRIFGFLAGNIKMFASPKHIMYFLMFILNYYYLLHYYY